MEKYVLYVLGQFPTLSETFIIRELNEIERKGIKISVLSLARRPDFSQQMHEFAQKMAQRTYYIPDSILEVIGVIVAFSIRYPVMTVRLWKLNWGWPILPGYSKFKRWIKCMIVANRARNVNANHLHGHWTNPSDVAAMVGQVLDIPYSFTLHAHDIYDEDPILEAQNGGIALRSQKAQFVTTCTQYNYQHLSTHYRERLLAPLYTVYHGVDTVFYQPGNVHNSTPIIISVGRIIPYKGFDRLVEILNRVWNSGISFTCYIVGDGSLREQLINRVAELGLQDTIRFTGPLPAEQVKDYYAMADIFALVGSVQKGQYGLPNVLTEAMSAGLAVLTTTLPPVDELIEDGVDGIIVPDDDEVIYHALCDLLKKPETYGELGIQARKKVTKKFSIEINTERLCQLFWNDGNMVDRN